MQINRLDNLRRTLITEVREASRALHWVDGVIEVKKSEQEKEYIMESKDEKERLNYVEARLQSAALTLRRLPKDQMQGYNSTWPEVIQPTTDAEKTNIKKLKIIPSAQDITDMEEVLFVWMKYLDDNDCKLVWKRADRVPWKDVCEELNISRNWGWKIYQRALKKIARTL